MTRFPLTAIGACAAIIAAHALPIRASAEETRPDCIAMRDLITTCADQQAMTANPTDTAASKDGTYPKYEVWTSDPYGP